VASSKYNYLGINVLEAAKQRIRTAITEHDDFYVSFSGGKDSGVMVNLVLEAARELDRTPVKVVFSDLEVIYQETARYVASVFENPDIDPYWLCLEEYDDNASSMFERYFKIWDRSLENHQYVRDMPTMPYVINNDNMPAWLEPHYDTAKQKIGDWVLTHMGEAFADRDGANSIVAFIAVRTDESYGRLMNVRTTKHRRKKNNHTYRYARKQLPRTWVCMPMYDWKVSDVWHYYAITGLEYSRVYDQMMRMGISPHAQRTCSAFGDEQKQGLYQWCVIEPDTWERMVTRVAGANFGKRYNHTNLNSRKVRKPESLTWKEYTNLLLATLPAEVRDIFNEKFQITFRYHKTMYEDKEGIPPEIYIQDSRKEMREAMKRERLSYKYFITWEDFAGAIIKRDFVFKRYGFGYSRKMEAKVQERIDKWQQL
jgi:predicted phosphoadenosine phosphosulfate sulfurtransferase